MENNFWKFKDLVIFFFIAIFNVVLIGGITFGCNFLIKTKLEPFSYPFFYLWDLLMMMSIYLFFFRRYSITVKSFLGKVPVLLIILAILVQVILIYLKVSLTNGFSDITYLLTIRNLLFQKDFLNYLLINILGISLIPFWEELLIRGVFLNYLRKKIGIIAAILLISIFFAFLHLYPSKDPNKLIDEYSLIPCFFVFIESIILSYSVIKTNSLRIAIAMHMTNNFFALIIEYLYLHS